MINIWSAFKARSVYWLIASLCLYASLASLGYYFWRLSPTIALLCLALSIIITTILDYFGLFFNEKKPFAEKSSLTYWFWLSLASFLLIGGLLVKSRTTDSIISPWSILPGSIFLGFFLLSLASLAQKRISKFGFIAFFAVYFSIIAIIYRLGYGYDFFVHAASLKKIIETGLITPKTPYYLGHYALLYLSNLAWPLLTEYLQIWLVPLVSILLLPWLAWRLKTEPRAFIILSLLTLPFLTFTTPQNLGLLLLLAEVLCLMDASRSSRTLASLFVLANLFIHPLSGIPALALLLATLLPLWRSVLARLSFWLGSSLPLFVPLILLATGLAKFKGFHSLPLAFWPQAFILPQSEGFILNLTYGLAFNLPLLFLVCLLCGLILKRGQRFFEANLGLALGLIVASLLMSLIEVKGVIAYEQADYAKRLIIEGLIILMPFYLATAEWLYLKITKLHPFDRYLWLGVLAGLLTMSFYLTYPRHDNFFNSRGLSISAADVAAVTYIEERALHEPYIVLANQQVSAAALSRFGFAHYYGDNFYYPLPTTNPLYDYYLKMAYGQPTFETAQAAMDSVGVRRCYFVLNRYWQDFPKILEQAKLSTTNYKNFDNQVYVFEYLK